MNSKNRRSLVVLLASSLLATAALTTVDARADDAGYEGPLQNVAITYDSTSTSCFVKRLMILQ